MWMESLCDGDIASWTDNEGRFVRGEVRIRGGQAFALVEGVGELASRSP